MDHNDGERPAARRQVLVIGGGLAGISAACELAGHGFRATLLEKRPYLGGRTFSFIDNVTGAEVDNGQHVLMKCCTAYLGLLRKLGVQERVFLQARMRVRVFDGQLRASGLSSAPLSAPFHLLPSFLTYRHLTWREKMAVVRAISAIRRVPPGHRKQLDGISFHDWLVQHGQSQRSIERFWDLITIPILNDPALRVSASQAIMVFQDGFLKERHGADIGYARVGLSGLLAKEAVGYIEQRGGAVLLGKSVACLEGGLDGIRCAHVHGGAPVQAEAYILAVPPLQMGKLLPEALRKHEFFDRASRLTMSPIVNVHVWLDRKVADWDFAAFLDNDVQWVFNKTAMYGQDGGVGQHLCVSLSAAHSYIDMPKEELYNLVLRELGRAIPKVKGASVKRHIIVRERHATFSPRPGSAAYRLTARTPAPNLFLAGEWTDTGWPSTMESAVRSGVAAAEAVAKAL